MWLNFHSSTFPQTPTSIQLGDRFLIVAGRFLGFQCLYLIWKIAILFLRQCGFVRGVGGVVNLYVIFHVLQNHFELILKALIKVIEKLKSVKDKFINKYTMFIDNFC